MNNIIEVKNRIIRIVLYSACFFVLPQHAWSQAPNLEWVKSFGGTDIEGGTSIVLDASGNVYATGLFRGGADFDPGPGVFTLAAGANPDVFVLKLDPSGNLVWAKQFGAINDDRGFGIALDGSGNVYATGQFQGTVDFDPNAGVFNMTAVGNLDAFVVKLDGSGNFVWAKAFGGTDTDRGNAIAANASGVYVCGFYDETVDFDPGAGTFNITSVGPGTTDVFILKLDLSGNFSWAKSVGGGDNGDNGSAIDLDGTGNVYVTGNYQLTCDFDPGAAVFNLTSAGQEDLFVLKLDPSGNFIWAKSMGGVDEDRAYGLVLDSDDNVYTTGNFYETADFDPGAGTSNLISTEDEDMYISKLNSAGDFVWAKRIGDTGSQNGYGLSVDGDDNIYATGYFVETVDFDPNAGTFNMTANSGYDIFVVRLDPSGDFDWAVSMGANGLDIGQALTVDAAGAIFLTGFYSFTVDFDPGPGTTNVTYVGNVGNSDMFLLKLSTGSTPGNQPPVIQPMTTALSVGGVVTVDLLPLLSDPDNNLDPGSLTLLTDESDEGAEATINSSSQLLLDYGGVFFVGTDFVTIEVCDLSGSCTQQELTIEVTGDLLVYTGISPNGDQHNGTWQIKNIDILPDTQDNKVTIYNRWGDKVFSIAGYDNDEHIFNGISDSGSELPSGTYFYRIEFPGGRASKTGYLVLKR